MTRVLLKFKTAPWELFQMDEDMDKMEILHPRTGKIHTFERSEEYGTGVCYKEIDTQFSDTDGITGDDGASAF